MKSLPSIWQLLHIVKSFVKISSIFVAFLENMNFNRESFLFLFIVNISFLGRWGFAYTYDAKERILFMHGGFSATHNHGQTILFQINSISKCPVPVLGLIHLLAYSSFI